LGIGGEGPGRIPGFHFPHFGIGWGQLVGGSNFPGFYQGVGWGASFNKAFLPLRGLGQGIGKVTNGRFPMDFAKGH